MERDSGYSFITSQSQSNLPNILNIVLLAGKAKSSVETLFLPPFHTESFGKKRNKIKSL
jgi:hypothetical protein